MYASGYRGAFSPARIYLPQPPRGGHMLCIQVSPHLASLAPATAKRTGKSQATAVNAYAPLLLRLRQPLLAPRKHDRRASVFPSNPTIDLAGSPAQSERSLSTNGATLLPKMSSGPGNPEPLLADFEDFIHRERLDGVDCEGNPAHYVPYSSLQTFWTEDYIEEIFYRCGIVENSSDILNNYLQGFSTLMYISSKSHTPCRIYLNHMRRIRRRDQDDKTLPWVKRPDNLFDGPGESGTFEEFREAQWMFCPVVIDPVRDRMSDRHLHLQHILPITITPEKDIRRPKREATISVVEIHLKAHGHLVSAHKVTQHQSE